MASKEPLLPKGEAKKPFQVTSSPPVRVLLNPFAWLFWILDFAIWVITIIGPLDCIKRCCTSKNDAVQVDGNWRLKTSQNSLVSREDAQRTTVHEVFQHAVKTFGSNKAVGTRKYLGQHKEEGAKFPLQMFGETEWLTYAQFGANVKGFGAGLIKLGLRPAPAGADLQKVSGPHTLLIFEETCAQWATAALGAFSQSIAVATSYATLGMGAVVEAINETQAAAIVCNISNFEKVAKSCAPKCPSLKAIILSTNNSVTDQYICPEGVSLEIRTVDQLVREGNDSGIAPTPPTPETLAVIMYTSGSTGKPKGVMIPHKSMVASIAAVKAKVGSLGLEEGKETYLAYLPAAHILELIAELANFAMGSAVGFADPRTISSKGACRKKPDGTINTKPEYPYPPGAIQEFQPTLMAGVPKIWDMLKKGVEDTVGKFSPVKQFMFQVAYSGRFWAVNQGRDCPLLKALVLKNLSGMLGGRLKVGLTGGGPISADVQTFIRTAFCMPLLQGYALTETCCAGTIQSVLDIRCGVVGPPVGSVEIKLRSCMKNGEAEVMDREKKPYLSTDTTHYGEPCAGRGEVLIRGPSVSAGYFKQGDKTDEVFKDGWFYTGDVAVFTPDGCIKIVDRVKNLVKLKGGEYIAIEAMEKEYSTSPYVNPLNGGIMCYGDGDMDKPVALIQANVVELKKWAHQTGTDYGGDVEKLCKLPAAEKLVLDSCVAAAKSGGLGANEILKAVALISGEGSPQDGELNSPWTPENGGLTASNKLNRQPIMTTYKVILDPLKQKGIM